EFTAERRLPQTTADYRSAGNSTANLKRRFATRKRVTQDAPDHLAVLLHHRAGVVVLAITLADLAHFHRHLRIAPCRDIRKQAVLDLVAQVAGHDMELPAA